VQMADFSSRMARWETGKKKSTGSWFLPRRQMRDSLGLTDQAAMTSDLFTRRGRWSQDQMRLESNQ
jgi:hypothetical protein